MTQSPAASSPPDAAPRRRVLISAYACGPGEGSEPGAGWAFVTAAAAHNEVWVITRERFADSIRAALDADPFLAQRVHVVHVDLSPRVLHWKKRARDVYWYYALWQRRMLREARRLHAEHHFDVAHHATFATDWQVCGLRRLAGVPLVWGPVGGSTYQPLRLLRWLGARSAVTDLARSALTRAARRVWGDPMARRADVVVGLNPDVARRFRNSGGTVVVEPNIALYDGEFPQRATSARAPGEPYRAVFVGRLTPWKGTRLALATLAHPDAAAWTLDYYGDGADAAGITRLAAELGVSDRVRLHGLVPRSEALHAIAGADAMLFPSMHDSAPWVVGEASAIGCPVVCLDHGGPPVMAAGNARLVPVSADVVPGLAARLKECQSGPGRPTDRWSAQRLTDVVEQWYAAAQASR